MLFCPRPSCRLTSLGTRFLAGTFAFSMAIGLLYGAEAAKRRFDLNADHAEKALKAFSTQAGIEVLFPSDAAAGVRTNAVKGEYTPIEAVRQMLAGTSLYVRDDSNGVVRIAQGPAPNAQRAAPMASDRPSQTAPLLGKPASEPRVADSGQDRATVLSPFEVSAGRDEGFVAASSLAGGRLASDLKDTPVAYSVLTREFIDALDITSLTGATEWTVNAITTPDDGRNNLFGSDILIGIRGVSANGPQRDFFSTAIDFDSYALERFDFARGPNAVLFGYGQFGGTANVVSKRAQIGRNRGVIRLGIGSWGDDREVLDYNLALSRHQAVRLSAVHQDRHGWRDYEHMAKEGIHLAYTLRLNRKTELRAEAEWARRRQNIPITTIGDSVSGWDGVTTFAGPVTAANAPKGVARIGAPTNPFFTYSTLFGTSDVLPMFNTARTVGGYNASNTPIGGRLVVGPTVSAINLPITNAINLPDNRFDLAIAGSAFFVPADDFAAVFAHDTYTQSYHLFSLFLNHQIGEHIFLEAAGNRSDQHQTSEYLSQTQGFNNVQIDLNQFMPGGTTTNPGFLQPYADGPNRERRARDEIDNLRLAVALVFDHTRLGDFRLSTMAGYQRQKHPIYLYRYNVRRDDPRTWNDTANELRYRLYWNQPDHRMAYPTKVTFNGVPYDIGYVLSTVPSDARDVLREITYEQAAFTANLFKRHLDLLASVRHDNFKGQDSWGIDNDDYPANWDGTTAIKRPKPPSNYLTLPAAQQAVYGPPDIDASVVTLSTGAVLHLTEKLGVYGNYAKSFNPNSIVQTIDGTILPPQVSSGYDLGVRFTLSTRFSVTVSRYAGVEHNASVATGTAAGLPVAIPNQINNIVEASPIGNTSTRNTRGLVEVPDGYVDRRDRKTRGYELDLTANLTPSWRLLINYARPEASQTNAYSDTRRYLEANDAILRQILTDTGVLIDSNNNAFLNPAIEPARKSNDADAAVASWNNLQKLKANLVDRSQVITRSVKYTANLFTDYSFGQGRLRGFKIGGGINLRGPQAIGYRGGDTIRDPSNPNNAIDDPRVDAYSVAYAPSYKLVTGVLGYSFKLRKGKRLQLDLRVTNLLNNRTPRYYNTVLRPPGGDVSNPARVSTPGQYAFLPPRAYSFTATLDF